MQILYKKDSKGKIRLSKLYTDRNILIQETGLLGGKMTKRPRVCHPKNVGKSSETTGAEQAQKELESKVNKMLTKGYFFTEQEARDSVVILPMLAKSYDSEERKIDWSNAFAQPKYDGMRALGVITKDSVSLISRDGKNILETSRGGVQHIIDSLTRFRDISGFIGIIDGELYAHGYTFEENMKFCKSVNENNKLIKFVTYDMVSDKGFIERYRDLSRKMDILKDAKWYNLTYLEVAPIYIVYNHNTIETLYRSLVPEYEGVMIRWGNSPYKMGGRSSNLLKYKKFIDIALPLKDVEPSSRAPEQGVPVFFWKGAENNELRAGLRMSHEAREDLLTNKDKYIGKTCEIRFFEYGKSGVPRFPVMYGFRNDK